MSSPTAACQSWSCAEPKQWAKNVLVFVAPAAAGHLNELYTIRLTLMGFVAFCLVSSAEARSSPTKDCCCDVGFGSGQPKNYIRV